MSLSDISTTISLDLYDHDLTPSKIKAIALDSKTRYVNAQLTKGGQQYDIGQSTAVTLTIIRPDKTGVQVTGATYSYLVYIDGTETTMYGARAELTQTALAVSGTLQAQFMFTSGEQILRSEIFTINNGIALDSTVSEWAGEYQGYNLDELVQNVNESSAKVDAMEQDVSELKSGLNDVNAELADVRVGADGTTYTSAGAAVRGQVGNINARMVDIIAPNWQQGAINSSGQIISNDSLKYTATAIRVYKDHVYTVDNNVIYRIKYYANEPLIGTTIPTAQPNYTQTSYTAPNDGWIAIVVYNANIGNVIDSPDSSVTLSSLDNRIKNLDNEFDKERDYVNMLSESLNDVKNELNAHERYKTFVYPDDFYSTGKSVNGNTVGNVVTFASSPYRSTIEADIPEDTIACHIVYAMETGETVCAVVTDEDDIVLKTITGLRTNQTYMRIYIGDIVGAKKIYWTAFNLRTTHILFEYDKYSIFEGEKVHFTNVSLTTVNDSIKDEKAIKYSLSSATPTTDELTFSECGDMTLGVYLKMPVYDQVKSTTSITIQIYRSDNTEIRSISVNPNCLQMGDWVFVKTPFSNNSQNRLATKIKITLTFTLGYTDTVTLLISPFVVLNNFNKAVYVFNQDSFWGASETCGFYDYMIDNNIPFSVTGVNNVNDPVSAAMMEKLRGAYDDGLLDVGIYTNEQPTSHPISNNATSFIVVQEAMEHLIDSKITDGFYPVTIGCGTNYIPPAIRKSIDFSGFKAIRGGTSGGNNTLADSMNDKVLFITGDITSKTTGGSYALSMYHGVSIDPTAESDPSLYVLWSSVKSLLDTLIASRDNHEVLLMNMKQFIEYKNN